MNEKATKEQLKEMNYITTNGHSFHFDFPSSFNSEQKEAYQFTLIRDFILKHHTLFLEPNLSFPPLEGTMLAYYYQDDKQFFKNNASTLLEFLVLNPSMLKKFQDDKLIEQIKTLVLDAKKDAQYNEKLERLFFYGIQNTTSIEFLLKCGMDANIQMNGMSTLMATRNTGVIKALIKAGANIHATLELDYTSKYFFGKKLDSKSIFHQKNALEIHSLLQHSSIVKILQSHQNNPQDTESYFYKQYLALKEHFFMSELIKEMKRDNPIILDNLGEFIKKETFSSTKFDSFIKEIINKNKTDWFDKFIEIDKADSFLELYKNKNDYLLQAIHKEHYAMAAKLIENGFYQKEGLHYLINKSYDSKLANLYYDILGQDMSFKHILQGCDVELVKKHYQTTSIPKKNFIIFVIL